MELSSVSHHAFERYLCHSVAMKSSELMHLSVKQLHLWIKSLVAKGTSYIHEASDLDHEGTCVSLSQCRAMK